MTAADARRLHGARGGEIGGPQAHAVHARRRARNRLHIVDALRGFQDGVNQNRFFDFVARFELRQQLVEIVDVPGAVDLRQHDDVESVADRAHDLDDIVERPRRIERVDTRPQSGRAIVDALCHRDEAVARGLLGLDRNGVFEIAQHHVHLTRQLGHLGAQFFEMRRHKMDHALQPHRQLAHGRGRADGERSEELAGQFHGLLKSFPRG